MTDVKAIAEVFGGPAFDIERPYWKLFADTATRHPHNEAVVSLWQIDWNGQDKALRWTYAELLNLCENVSAWLYGQGCQPGMTIAAFLGNSAEWVLFMWVAARIGLTFVPLEPSSVKTDGGHFAEAVNPHIVIVEGNDAANEFDQVARHKLSANALCISCADGDVEGWHSLSNVIAAASSKMQVDKSQLPSEPDETRPERLIFFTSGTTGSPKGCPLTAANIWSQTWDWEPPQEGSFDRWLLHTPVSHILGCNHALRMFRQGGTVVFSGKRFDVSATYPALKQEKCTKMAAVPTLIRALLASDSFGTRDDIALHYVTLGGTIITPDDIKLCQDGLGVKAAVQGFGLTEGMPLACWHSRDPLLAKDDGYHPGVGRALRGANLRICDPQSHKTLLRNEVGELHVSGSSVINGYLNGIEPGQFYVDGQGVRWFKTGDQARIDDDGVLHILGRYKDLIIRGGENISPAKIERAISSLPGVVAQVIPLPDEIAGQVPVAVVKPSEDVKKAAIFKAARSLGAQYALDAIYLLSELSLASFPTTSLGKVKKQELQRIVMEYRKTQEQAALPIIGQDIPTKLNGNPVRNRTIISATLSHIWEDLIGFSPDTDDSVLEFADSITILRFCAQVYSVLNTPLYLQDIPNHKTIRQQADLLEKRRTGVTSQRHHAVDTRFSLDTVVLADGSLDRLTDIQTSAACSMEQLNIPISDIEAYMSVSDSLKSSVTGSRPQSFHHRFVANIVHATPSAIRTALETAMSTRQTFRSLLGHLLDGTPYHIVVKPTPTLFSLLIQSVTVDSTKVREEIENDTSAKVFSELLMLRIKIVTCSNDDSVHVIFDYNHSAFDLLTLFAFYQDVDKLLSNPQASLVPLTPFKQFADVTHLYRDSALASASVSFYVSQIRELIDHKEALWPTQKAPGWMIGRDQDSTLFHQRDAVRVGLWGSHPPTPELLDRPMISHRVECPALEKIKIDYGVPAKVVLQASLKLFNVLTTRQRHAVLGVLDDGRSWPFMPEWIAETLPSPASIAGPTIETLLSITAVDVTGGETVGQYLKRVHEEWLVCRQHAHAPLSRTRLELGEHADDFAPNRQMFTWDSSLDMLNWSHIQAVSRQDWPDCGVFWNGVQIDARTLEFYGSWDTAQMSHDEFAEHCGRNVVVLQRLTKVENLEKTLDVVIGDLTHDWHDGKTVKEN